MASYKLTLGCGDRDGCLELLETILKAKGVRAEMINGEIRDCKLVITITGNKLEIHQTRRAIRKVYREWREFREWLKGRECISINNLMRIVNNPFPSDALAEVLSIMGWKTVVKGGEVCTNADRELLIGVCRELANALKALVKFKPKASYTAKCLITSASVLTNKPVQEVMSELINKGFLTEEGPRLITTSEWRSLLRKLTGCWRGQGIGVGDKEENG